MRRLLLAMLVLPLVAWGADAERRLQQWLQGQQPESAGLTLEIAPWVEDGAFVPIELSLSGAQPPLSLLLLRSAEPESRIAAVTLKQWAEPLRLSTRVRLTQTQDVIALARDARGRVWAVRQSVEVLASSCLTPQSAQRPAGFGQLQVWAERGQSLELRTLLRHPMETGRRPDLAGGIVPRHLPQLFEVNGPEGQVMRVEPFEGLSVNPYWRVLLPLRTDALELRWTDGDGTQFNTALQLD